MLEAGVWQYLSPQAEEMPKKIARAFSNELSWMELAGGANEVEHCFVRDIPLTARVAMSLLHRRRVPTGRLEGTWNRSRAPAHNADIANASIAREHTERMLQPHLVNTLRRGQSQLLMVAVHGLLVHSARRACDLKEGGLEC